MNRWLSALMIATSLFSLGLSEKSMKNMEEIEKMINDRPMRPSNIAPMPIMERPTDLINLINELKGARLARVPLQVLDVGTQDGKFIENINAFLEKHGLDSEILGVDDYRYFGDNVKDLWSMFNSRVLLKKCGHILFATVENLSPKMDNHFDLIFINAPMLDNHTDVIGASMKLLKDDGSIILRYFDLDDHDSVRVELYAWVYKEGWIVSKIESDLPEGTYPLSRNAYVLRRKEAINFDKYVLFELFGSRLADAIDSSA